MGKHQELRVDTRVSLPYNKREKKAVQPRWRWQHL